MIDREKLEHLSQLAYHWAKAQEELVLARGIPLGASQLDDARRVGVRDCDRVRVLVVDRMPLPDNEELAEVARRTQTITEASRGAVLGHGIIIRADSWGDREVLLHQLAHVAQCERSGGLEPWVRQYVSDRHTCASFTIGALEEEARGLARKICAETH